MQNVLTIIALLVLGGLLVGAIVLALLAMWGSHE